MLFYLTKTLVVDNSDPNLDNILLSVNNIATTVISGNHLLLGDFDSIVFFREKFKDSPVIYALFNELYQNFATQPIPICLTYYIEIVKENPISRNEDDIEIQQIIYSDFTDSDHCIKTQLVCEDLNDCHFYEHVLKWFIDENDCNVSFTCGKLNGGGKNTYRVVDNEIRNKHCTICIVDTDIKFPNDVSAIDSTYGKCRDLKISTPIYKLLPLYVREIENLVPLNYFDHLDWSNSNDENNKKSFDYLRKDAEEILPYFDYKKGIKKDEKYKSNIGLQKFAKHCFSQNTEYIEKHPDFETYVNNLNEKECIYPHLLGGCRNMNEIINLINNKILNPELLNFQRKNWNIIGQNLLNWCIGKKKESIH